MKAPHVFFFSLLSFRDTDLSGRIIINVKSKSAGFSPSHSFFPSSSCSCSCSTLLAPPSTLPPIICYFLRFGALPDGLPFLLCGFVREIFISLLIVPYRLTAKLRYENKQLALELTAEKKSTANAPSQTLLFPSFFFLLRPLLLKLSPNNIQEKADGERGEGSGVGGLVEIINPFPTPFLHVWIKRAASAGLCRLFLLHPLKPSGGKKKGQDVFTVETRHRAAAHPDVNKL